MDKVELKINMLKCAFVRHCLPILALKHFFLIIVNYYFSNLISVIAGAVFVGIVLGVYLSYLFSPDYLAKLVNTSCVFFLFFDLVYGVLNHSAWLFLFLNIFLYPWILYMFFPLRKTILITCSTMFVYPADLLYGSYWEPYKHTGLYENFAFSFVLVFNLILLFMILYYGTEINKYNSILLFKARKKLDTKISYDQKQEPESNVKLSYHKIFERIDLYMRTEQPWRSSDYGLEQLALDLGLNVIQISTAVNYCTKNNFKSYLNDYRLNAFVEEIKTHNRKDFLMKQVYMDLGFNSRATFNRNFKSKFRKTPQEFVAMHLF
ncbi:helix-turn-helix domain-containing protein [Flavobacterium sp. 3-210]